MTTVLIVDDNPQYRSAFKRNLVLRDYEVLEAEDGEEALEVFRTATPDVVVTDLSMRTPNEGLDVIRSVKQLEPLVPIVMISAVGTFEEGAEATRLGAHSVISKSRIEVELESLYETIERARESGHRNREAREQVGVIRERRESATQDDQARLRAILSDPQLHPTVRGDAYDALMTLNESDLRRSIEDLAKEADLRELEAADKRLAELVKGYETFELDTRKELRTAELFFHRQGGDRPAAADFSRNIGFSFCFAVENEAKVRLRKRLNKFLSQKETPQLVKSLLDDRQNQLDLFYHQYLVRLQQSSPFDFTIDNVRQVFQRVLEHEGRYKPDGLKALGIIILCFGRTYETKSLRRTIKIDNPLNIKGIDTDPEMLQFVFLLVSLQHLRNPYIHPEISEMEKVSKIRDTALECLRQIARLH